MRRLILVMGSVDGDLRCGGKKGLGSFLLLLVRFFLAHAGCDCGIDAIYALRFKSWLAILLQGSYGCPSVVIPIFVGKGCMSLVVIPKFARKGMLLLLLRMESSQQQQVRS